MLSGWLKQRLWTGCTIGMEWIWYWIFKDLYLWESDSFKNLDHDRIIDDLFSPILSKALDISTRYFFGFPQSCHANVRKDLKCPKFDKQPHWCSKEKLILLLSFGKCSHMQSTWLIALHCLCHPEKFLEVILLMFSVSVFMFSFAVFLTVNCQSYLIIWVKF